MNIKFIKAYKSIQEGFEWKDVPNYAIITGLNGVGKTQLLNAIKENNDEIVSITDDGGEIEDIVTYDEKRTYKQSIEGLIEYKNNSDERQGQKKELEDKINRHFGLYKRAMKEMTETTDLDSKHRNQKEAKNNLRWIKDYRRQLKQLFEYAYEMELRDVSKIVGKEPNDLSDDEVRTYAKPHFTTLTVIEDFERYVTQENDVRKDIYNQLLKKRDYNKAKEESEKDYAYQIINRYFHKFGFDYFEMQDSFGESSMHRGKIWFKGKMEEEVEYNDLSSGEQMIVKYIFWTFGRDFRGNRINTMLLDEPDSHLHPSMCKMMVNLLYELSKPRDEGGSGIRIIIITHSPSTVAFAPEGNLFVMEKNNDNKRSIRLVSTEEAEDVLSEGIFTYRKAINTFNIALSSQRQNLLFVEGKTDAIHIRKAIDILEMGVDVEIIPIHDAVSLGDFIRSTPSALFGGKKMMALFDSDGEGEKAYKKIEGDEKKFKGIKIITAEQSEGLSYAFKIQPSDASLSKHCPIEFLYPKEYLETNGVLELRNYEEYMNEFKAKTPEETDLINQEYKNKSSLKPFLVNNNAKSGFVDKVEHETDPAIFEGFKPTLELMRKIIEL